MITFLIISLLLTPATTFAFNDIAGHQHEEAILKLRDIGVLVGRGDGSFNPNDTLLRAEAAKVAAMVLGFSEADAAAAVATPVFDDVFTGMGEHGWAVGWINLVAKEGLIVGDGTGKYNPGDVLQKNEWITILLRLTGHENTGMRKNYSRPYCHFGRNNMARKGVTMTKVALLKVEDYQEDIVKETIEEAFLLLGLKEDFFAGQQVLLKPNLLTFSAAEGVVCTHPSIIKGMASLAMGKGAQVTAGDSPGFGSLARVAASCGLKNVLTELDIPLLSFEEKVEVKFPAGQICKSFFLGQPLTEGKKLVSLARLKTHGLTRYTGAVKNLYGCIAGKHKGALHLRYQKIDDFSKMLADLLGLLQPTLSLVDGIVSMEGSGPRSGTPRQTGFIVMSEDAVAADVVACTLVGIDPGQVLHLKFAAEMGWGEADFNQLELVGDSLDNLRVSDFKQTAGSENTLGILPPFLVNILRDFFISLPYVKLEKCTGCGVCVKSCPPGIITLKDEKAHIAHASCIRCYCCQELCPHEAIELKRKWRFR